VRAGLRLDSTTLIGENVTITVQNNNAYTTLAGGVNVKWRTKGQLLTANHPAEDRPGWKISSKSHRSIESCPVTAYAIGIQNWDIPGWGYARVYKNSANGYFLKSAGTSGSGTRRNELDSKLMVGFAPVAMGTLSTSTNGAGRLIQRMGCYNGNNGFLQVFSQTKDHFAASSGTTYTYLTGLSRW
jgi:hypothetical protein